MADYEIRHICGKGESCMAKGISVVEADTTSTSYNWNYKSNSSVPYLADENYQFVHYVYADVDVGYPNLNTKKKGLRLKKLHSTRARGRSSPLKSLALKICRFKVRTVLLVDTTGTDQTQQTR